MGTKYGIVRIDKNTYERIDSVFINELETFKTASMIKVILGDLILSADIPLDSIIEIPEDSIVSAGGVFHLCKHTPIVTLEILIYLMFIISDNTATNIILDLLKKKGSINEMISARYGSKHTKVLDEFIEPTFEEFKGGGESTIKEFLQILIDVLYKGENGEKIRSIMSNNYIQGRGLRYITGAINSGNKTGHLDNAINDCGFIEIEEDIYTYCVSIETEKGYDFEYGVENPYSKKIGNIVSDGIEKLGK